MSLDFHYLQVVLEAYMLGHLKIVKSNIDWAAPTGCQEMKKKSIECNTNPNEPIMKHGRLSMVQLVKIVEQVNKSHEVALFVFLSLSFMCLCLFVAVL